MKKEWIKLERGNDWAYEYLAIKALGPHGANAGRCITTCDGEQVDVRWPDGKETKEEIAFKSFKSSYREQGQMYPTEVSYTLQGIRTSVNGVQTWVPLDAVEVLKEWAISKTAKEFRP